MRTSADAIPEVASLTVADMVTLEANHPLVDFLPFTLTLIDGVTVSMETVVEEFAIFPALSAAVTAMTWTPSFRVTDDCHAPLFTETNAPAKPETESAPVGVTVTGERYQPFCPAEPFTSIPTEGGAGSKFQLVLPEAESPDCEAVTT